MYSRSAVILLSLLVVVHGNVVDVAQKVSSKMPTDYDEQDTPRRTSLLLKRKVALNPVKTSKTISIIGATATSATPKKGVASTSPSNTKDMWRGPACIIGGALAHLTLGTLYCWGNFISYAPQSLRFFDGKDHPNVPPDALYVMPLTLVAQAAAMPFGPFISKYLGYSGTMLLGSWITAAAVYLASYQTRLLPFMLLYSLMFGTGCGLAYTAPMAAGWKWMPNQKGLVSGGILTGFGAGGFIFGMIGSKLANPDRLNPVKGKFPSSVYDAFPQMLRTLAILYAGLSFVGSLLVTEGKSSVDDKTKSPSKAAAPKPVTAPWGTTVGESLKTHQFWLMWVMIISSATAGLNTAAIYKQYAATSSALVGDDYQVLVGGIGALFNGIGRLFWGSVSDIIGFKNSFTVLTLLQMALMLVYQYSTVSKVTKTKYFCR